MRLLLLFLPLLLAAASTDLALPPAAAQRAIEAYDAAVAKAKAVYDASLRTASTDFNKALAIVQAEETRKGNLDGALAVRALLAVTAEKNGVPADAGKPAEPKLAAGGPSLPAAQVAAFLAGSPTLADWERLPGVLAKVDALQRLETGLTLKAGERFAVLPCPTDQWGGGGSKRGLVCNYKGYNGAGSGWMALTAMVGTKPCALDEITGAGMLFLLGTDDKPEDNTGAVRVKIVRVQ